MQACPWHALKVISQGRGCCLGEGGAKCMFRGSALLINTVSHDTQSILCGFCPLLPSTYYKLDNLVHSSTINTTYHQTTMTRATEAAAFFGITTTIYLALLFQWLPITLPETVQNFTLPVVRNTSPLRLASMHKRTR